MLFRGLGAAELLDELDFTIPFFIFAVSVHNHGDSVKMK